MPFRFTWQNAAGCLRAVLAILTTDCLAWLRKRKQGSLPATDKTTETKNITAGSLLGKALTALLRLLGVATALFTLTGWLGRYWWAFDLTSHFRVQYLAGAAVLLLAQVLRRRWRWAGFALALAVLNLAVLAPHQGLWPASSGSADSKTTIRAVQLNVRTENREFDRTRKFLSATRPDFAVLEEIDLRWQNELTQLKEIFPFMLAEAREDNFGIMLLSRHPFTVARIHYIGEAGLPSLSAQLTIGGTTLTVVGTHPLPPSGRENSRLRNEQLAVLAEFINQQSGPKVLLGDLNTTPWNYYFQRLADKTGLRDSAAGRGEQGSWPVRPFLLRIPLDHCLLSPELHITRREIGPDVGSDHFPVIVELQIP